ncbi:glycoside hydrolase [Microbacterium mangrovi]|uniref:beta-fructofuranosidase n=1 Tax=Microbacterium mangrovi TaxID=1348253 RepID=A0A0B2A1B5_9MICO|nr:family 43 glycosylhydrolase [Microbacterium mangrovi]KHK95395.1 glycoside hydrolase [Microbacterium mangrovi]
MSAAPVFFEPPGGRVGDVIPAVHEGVFHLWYLHEQRSDAGCGMPWHLVTTNDFVTFTDHGEAVPSGGPDAEDFNVYTGSVVQGPDATWHLFSTAQNPARRGADGRPVQLVAHATSESPHGPWRKLPEWTFGAPAGYETGDWRDPFVFHDGEKWRMLVAARHSDGPDRRRGTVAQLVSDDLFAWRPIEPLWDPRRFVAHECPDVFEWDGWWYLVYSEFTDTFCTRYRMARSLEGPWIAPDDDAIDTRAFYAAKTVARDGRRFFVGWIADRENDDDGAWQWAGTMAVLEATQRADGTLAFGLPAELVASFDEPVPAGMPDLPLALAAPDAFRAIVGTADLPEAWYARAEIRIADRTAAVGLLLRADADGGRSGIVQLEPRRGRVLFDRWPRTVTGGEQWQISGDVPFEFDRPVRLDAGPHIVEIVTDGELVVVVVDGQVSLSTRFHARAGARFGFFVSDGEASLESLIVHRRN